MLSRRAFLEILAGGAASAGASACGPGASLPTRGAVPTAVDVPILSKTASVASVPARSRATVGAFYSMSGEQAAFGRAAKNGIELALRELDSTRPASVPMRVRYEDDASNATVAVAKVKQLIERDQVVALLGEVSSAISIPCAQLAAQMRIPMLSPCSTNPALTRVGVDIFRACFIDDVQGRFAAEYIVTTLKKQNIGLLFAEDDKYSASLAASFRSTLAELGANLVVERRALRTDTAFDSLLKDVQAKKPDIVFAPLYYTQMLLVAKQAVAFGLQPDRFFGGDGWSDTSLFDQLPGARFIDHWAREVPTPKSKRFVAAFEAAFPGVTPDAIAALSYDSAHLLADAIARSNDGGPRAIREALAGTRDFDSVTGPLTMGADRNPIRAGVVMAIRGGVPRFESLVGP